jgi:hypothetical protein
VVSARMRPVTRTPGMLTGLSAGPTSVCHALQTGVHAGALIHPLEGHDL